MTNKGRYAYKVKKSTAKYLCWCTDCEREVGVTQDHFNHQGSDGQKWRRVPHYKGPKQKCFGSRNVVNPIEVYSAKDARDEVAS